MTNEQIIWENRCKLLEMGELEPTGRTVTYVTVDGQERTIQEPEEIHTFQMWKSLGYSVKKGEHAVAKFPIWKYRAGKKAEAEGDEEQAEAKGYCFMKMAFFFKQDQVEKK